MRLHISGTGIAVTPELRRRIRRRIDFALGRFGGRIRTLSVRLRGEAGSRGGIDHHCEIRVDTGTTPIVVRDLQDDVDSATALAVDKVQRALERQLPLRERSNHERFQTSHL
ncbi:MAG: HPF/RaiA family ribosome-associated protein [Bryobacterales bacterium]|nr:HPF/RaiA family ribosome-associated protein [Bryobacterales bacterium]